MRRVHDYLFVASLIIASLILYAKSDARAEEHCEEWVAKVVSVQGSVEAKRAGTTEWLPVKMNDTFCPGDMIRAKGDSKWRHTHLR